ncbi:MAG: FAD-dependent oxidoreductase, partial [Pseudomonadota bacterium]
MVAMVAAEAGQRVALFDKSDLGAATSGGWYGILHGGLRYLQSADLRRFRESIASRRWFAANVAAHVAKMPFLMPLYGRGLKRPSVFRGAFLADDLAGWDRNREVDHGLRITRGKVLNRSDTINLCQHLPQSHLQGGALWEELVVPDSQKFFGALIEQAKSLGVAFFPSTEVSELLTSDNEVAGIKAQTLGGPNVVEARANAVVNAAGPWAWELNARLDPDRARKQPLALAFNMVLAPKAPAPVGVSLYPAVGDGDMLFLYPQGAQTFAGTWYVPHRGTADDQSVDQKDVDQFLTGLNGSLNGIEYRSEDVVSIRSGLLPVVEAGTTRLASEDQVFDHG